MLNDPALVGMIVFAIVFVGTWGLLFAIFLRVYGDKRALARVKSLTAQNNAVIETSGQKQLTIQTLPVIGSLFLPGETERLAQLRSLFVQAGIYHAQRRRSLRARNGCSC